ncbi:hypothetical protein [Povalibacter sp.]|uniref:hypothetical protein n=1 Tax=Povalibacter sp. TaxID=1962978 RepID=UPI002F40EB9D
MPLSAFEFIAVILACAFAGSAAAEPFIGQFELKTLESAPGSLEFQSQNAWSWNQPARRIEDDDTNGFLTDENSVTRERYALELEIGLTHFVKTRIGIEFEKERFDEPVSIEQANDFDELKLAEIGAEVIAIVLPRNGDGAAVGFVAEVEGPVNQEEANHVSLGTIMEFRSGRWFAAAIPLLVHSFGGDTEETESVDDKWDFAYAAQIGYDFSESWSWAIEGYGTVERLGSSGHPSDSAQRFGDFDQHRAGAVVYYTHAFDGAQPERQATPASALGSSADIDGMSLTVGFGLLAGLNGNTAARTLKLSIEVQF